MKNKILVSCLLSFVSAAGHAASSTADLSSPPAKRENYGDMQTKAAKSGSASRVKISANLYYTAKSSRDSSIYREYNGCGDDGCDASPRSFRAEAKKSVSDRKYNLNNPFFQPLAGQFASLTDLSSTHDSFDFAIIDGVMANHTGSYSAGSVVLAESLSFGITDTVMAMGYAALAQNSLKLQWNYAGDDSETTPLKLDQWGLGVRWRFLNNENWIANAMGAYQSYSNLANAFMGEAKLGYKNDDTMIYGFGRIYSMNWKGIDSYGVAVSDDSGGQYYFTEKEGVAQSLWSEFGLGLFAAMNPDWSADLQLQYADGEWHEQVSATATVSYQPWRQTALSLWGQVALWDSADGFDGSSVYYGGQRRGGAFFDNYSHFAVGANLATVF